MGQKVVTMDTKLAAMMAEVDAGRLTVSATCARLGISRQTYYKYRSRFDAEGVSGLIPRSRRPHRSPGGTPEPMVQLIVAARAALSLEGWDNGATSIYYRLLRDGQQPPTARTVHRVLARAGLIQPQPGKRPRSSFRKFEFPATDDCWQIDAFSYLLADGEEVVVFELIDDRSRSLLDARGWPDEDTLGAWTCVAQAIHRYGKPLMVLSDNSLAFTGRKLGNVVLFEKNLITLGIKPIWTSPRHPQTCGKNERGHRTARHWLSRRPPAANLEELQQLLDRYRDGFNNRPHQALDGATPLEQRAASMRTNPRPGLAPSYPTTVSTHTATSHGAIGVSGVIVGLGVEYAGQQVSCFNTNDHVLIFYKHHLVHQFTIDRSRNYQHPLRPRGGKRRTLPL
jgi:transposase InsO family protein